MNRAIELDRENDSFEAPTISRGLLQILWQRKAFVLLGAFIGLALGFLYHTQKTTIYESTCQMVVNKIHNPLAGGNANAATPALVEDYISTNIAVLGSSYIADKAIKKEKLLELKTFENVGDPIGHIIANLTVGRDVKLTPGTTNNIIVLSYRGPVAEDCGAILRAIKNSFQDYLESKYHLGTDEVFAKISKARDTLRNDIDASVKELLDYRAKSPVISRTKDGYNMGYENLATLEVKKQNLELDLEKLKSEIAVLEKAIKEDKSLDFITYGSIAKLEQAQNQNRRYVEEPLVEKMAQEKALLNEYGEDHWKVKAIRSYIETLRKERQLLAPKAKEPDPAKQILNAWKYNEENLKEAILAVDKMLKEKKLEVQASSKFEIEESELRNKIGRFEKVYNHTVDQLTQTNLARENGGFEAIVLRPPGIGAKVAPIAYQNLTAGLMLGLLVGVGLGYLADMADKSFRSPEEIRDQLGLPLVGHIPFFKADSATTKQRLAGESTIEPMLCCYFKPKSLDSEAYRAVRTALFFSTQGQGLKVIQVTSPNKGDGKSLMIANLAITTAQSGKRVLLIDADCRRPRQHKIFNIPNDVGLTSVLTLVADAQDTIREACVPGLFVMGSGPIPPNPSELLVSPKFKELLDGLRDQYDYVFVDTPPLLAVTDPCVVAGKVDGLFLAIRLTRKGRPDAERAREILQSVNCNVFGIVVNGVTRVTSGLYSSQAYDYSDTYVDYENEDKDYYYADEDPEEGAKSKELAKQ